MNKKKVPIVIVLLIIAAIFVVGIDWAGKTVQTYFHSYFADIAIPFGYYFLLILLEDIYEPLKKWLIKGSTVFVLCAISETLQYFGIYALARIFDPIDFVMYGLGTVFAVLVDRVLFKRWFVYWN